VPVNVVDAPVDVGDPKRHVTPRAAVHADMTALEADRVGKIAAGGDDEVFQVHGIGEPARDPAHDVRHGLVPLLDTSPPAEDSDFITVRPVADRGARIAVEHGCLYGSLLFQGLDQRVISHVPASPCRSATALAAGLSDRI
jgi:hypothetical protein